MNQLSGRRRQGGPPLALLAAISLTLLLGGLAIGVALGGVMPLPYGPAAAVQEYFRAEHAAVQASAIGVFASSVPLAIYAATASARLRQLGVTAPGATIALAGGILAAGGLGLAGLVGWTLSRPDVAAEPTLVRALYYLVFLTGGPGHVVALGLLLAGIAVPSLILGLLPRPLAWAGLAIAALAEVTTLVLLWPGLAVLLPVARFAAPGVVDRGRRAAAAAPTQQARGRRSMKLSVSVTNYSWPDGLHDRLAALAEYLDNTAVDTLWVADHMMQADPSSQLDEPMLEAYTTLGYLAAVTSRLRLGTMVTAATFRAPVLLIKAVTTLDVLSGGRAWLGIGAGYNADEARATGLFLPETAERFDRLTELLALARQMWSGDETPYRGEYLRLEHPICSPLPMSSPRPPVLIGGTGERRTLRLVAQYGDACNLFDIPDGGRAIRRQLDVLARHCADVGRPVGEVERTVSTALQPGESADQLVTRCRALRDVGMQHVVVITRGRPLAQSDLDTVAGAADQLACHKSLH